MSMPAPGLSIGKPKKGLPGGQRRERSLSWGPLPVGSVDLKAAALGLAAPTGEASDNLLESLRGDARLAAMPEPTWTDFCQERRCMPAERNWVRGSSGSLPHPA